MEKKDGNKKTTLNTKNTNFRKNYKRGTGIFDDLRQMSGIEIFTRIDIVQKLISRSAKRQLREQIMAKISSSEWQIENLTKKLDEMDKKFAVYNKHKYYLIKSELKKHEKDVEKYREFETKLDKCKLDLLDSKESEASIDEELRQIKFEDAEKRILGDYTDLRTSQRLEREGKRTFVYSVIKEDFDSSYDIVREYDLMKRFDDEQRKLEEYFEQYEKKRLITSKDKEERAEKEREYKKLLRKKASLDKQNIEKRKKREEEGIDEKSFLSETRAKVAYYTDERNWDDIIEEITKQQEFEEPEETPGEGETKEDEEIRKDEQSNEDEKASQSNEAEREEVSETEPEGKKSFLEKHPRISSMLEMFRRSNKPSEISEEAGELVTDEIASQPEEAELGQGEPNEEPKIEESEGDLGETVQEDQEQQQQQLDDESIPEDAKKVAEEIKEFFERINARDYVSAQEIMNREAKAAEGKINDEQEVVAIPESEDAR